ncbi:MAG: type secretion system ATPase, FliI/YscN [Thermoleophilia bacterium]|nr:type secretion system ATPase, FliI/YscN [Thermoleophilia bacterium]
MTEPPIDLASYHDRLQRVDPYRLNGRVVQVIGLVIEAQGPEAQVGELCHVHVSRHEEPISAEVVGFREGRTLLMPIGEMRGIAPGNEVVATGHPVRVGVGDALLGRVVDATGAPIDGKGPIEAEARVSLHADPPPPLGRRRIDTQLDLGVRAMDALIPCGRGQRLGVFAGSGVGKSSLMGMIARSTTADVNVIALVGERGREVLEFIERDLGEEGMARSVVVVASSNESAVKRIGAAFAATSIAEFFRDRGQDVLLMMDSVTRFAMAQREIGLAIGEPPATRGFTPSVFALLPRLLERAGTADRGSITGLYTVLVEGDDMNEPIADAVRGILDGHVVLSRDLAHKNHYPAIDVLSSISRLQSELLTPEQVRAAGLVRETLATYADREDLVSIGAYAVGSDPKVDYAIAKKPEIDRFLQQRMDERTTAPEARAQLELLVGDAPPSFF